jgi:hypothetical protein
MNHDLVAKLHRTLVDALRRARPDALNRPITVAEIYQDILPYREAREAVGFEINADYEHTLLRLLAGEGDLARIEPREVRDKLRMELESPNPDVGLFRSYAGCDVWVSIDSSEIIRKPARFEIATDNVSANEAPRIVAAPEDFEQPAGETVPCAFCSAELPADRSVNFCPFCGTDQSRQPCPACGELLEPLWRFCVSCGTRVGTLGDDFN